MSEERKVTSDLGSQETTDTQIIVKFTFSDGPRQGVFSPGTNLRAALEDLKRQDLIDELEAGTHVAHRFAEKRGDSLFSLGSVLEAGDWVSVTKKTS